MSDTEYRTTRTDRRPRIETTTPEQTRPPNRKVTHMDPTATPGPANAPQPSEPRRVPHYLVLGAVIVVVAAIVIFVAR